MKLKKRTFMLISFCLGALLLATTALADIVSKSGYEQLKDALKTTAHKGSEELDSFTLDFSMVIKNNGETLISSNEISKFNRSNNARETFSNHVSVKSNNYTSYNYSDNKVNIRWSENQDTYYVTEFTSERNQNYLDNPFHEQGAEDIERIIDALVGNLKDHVMVKENPDGSKELWGSLSEMQIPALVNALASFQLKQEFNGRDAKMPHLAQDIFVKEISGRSVINKDGMMESILGSAILTGKDKQGQTQELSFEVLLKMSDINSTIVTMPDLTGKKVVTEVERQSYRPEISNPEKFIGLYKNNILIEKEGQYIKIGERFVQIDHLDNQTVTGRYFEEYRSGFEQHVNHPSQFSFDGTFEKEGRHGSFSDTDNSINGSIYFDEHLAKIYFNLNQYSGMVYDSTFSRVFD